MYEGAAVYGTISASAIYIIPNVWHDVVAIIVVARHAVYYVYQGVAIDAAHLVVCLGFSLL